MDQEICLPTHPRTGLCAVGIVAGRPVWPILGGSGEGDGGDGGEGSAEWTPPGSQAELDRIVQDRLTRVQKQYGMTPEEAVSYRERAEALEADLESESERAAREASETAFNAAMSQLVPRLVRAEFRSEAKGVLSDEQLDALLEGRDLTYYADDEGEPDSDKIAALVAKFAPTATPQGPRPPRLLGQGFHAGVKQSAKEIASAEIERRYGKKSA